MPDHSVPLPGAKLVFRWRKWDGSRHWEHQCVYLGRDLWGEWLGQLAGWRSERPGRKMLARVDNITLVPPSGEYALTVNRAPYRTRIYIDIGWDVRWSDSGAPEGIDMDLDVVRTVDAAAGVSDSREDWRGVFIDDEDEWAEHRELFGYPSEVVTRLEAVAAELRERVRRAEAPFDDATAERWLAELDRLTGQAGRRDRGSLSGGAG